MRLVLALPAGCAFGAMAIGIHILFDRIHLRPDQVWEPLRQFILSLCVLAAMPFLLPWLGRSIFKAQFAALSLMGACLLAAAVIWQWDQRTPWNRFMGASHAPPELVRLLPGNAPIYWEDSVAMPWFLLKRASYFTCDQGAGTLFSRETSIAYQNRYAHFQKLQTLDFRQYSFCPLTEARRTLPLQRVHLSTLCAEEPGLGTRSDAEHRAFAGRPQGAKAPGAARSRDADGTACPDRARVRAALFRRDARRKEEGRSGNGR
jgi:hypothetical protein